MYTWLQSYDILTGKAENPSFCWKETLTRVFLVAIGWAWGLMLFAKSRIF